MANVLFVCVGMTAPPWVPKLQSWASSKTLHSSPLPTPLSHAPKPQQFPLFCLPPPWAGPSHFSLSLDHRLQHISSWAFSPWMLFSPQIWADTFQFCPGLHKVHCMKLKQLDLKNKTSTIWLPFVSVIASSHYPQHLALGTLDGISFHTLPTSCVILFLMLTFLTFHLEGPSPTPISPSWST